MSCHPGRMLGYHCGSEDHLGDHKEQEAMAEIKKSAAEKKKHEAEQADKERAKRQGKPGRIKHFVKGEAGK